MSNHLENCKTAVGIKGLLKLPLISNAFRNFTLVLDMMWLHQLPGMSFLGTYDTKVDIKGLL